MGASTLRFTDYKLANSDLNLTRWHIRWGRRASRLQGKVFLKGKTTIRVAQPWLAFQDWVKVYKFWICWLGYRGISKQWQSAYRDFKTEVNQIPPREFKASRCCLDTLVGHFDQGWHSFFMTLLGCIHLLVRPCLKWSSFSKWSSFCSFNCISRNRKGDHRLKGTPRGEREDSCHLPSAFESTAYPSLNQCSWHCCRNFDLKVVP